MGQNFLSDPSTAETIISRAHLSSEDVVLEKFEIAVPTLSEIFIRVVEEGDSQ